jgi:hypothetical protein
MNRGVALVVLALAAGACARIEPAGEPWAIEAAQRHRAADELLDRGDMEGARAQLLPVLDVGGRDISEDRRRVIQDTCFRLARLDLDMRRPERALVLAEGGLALGRPADLFVANLLVVRGAAHEALGDAPAAADDYHQALLINDQLLRPEVERP